MAGIYHPIEAWFKEHSSVSLIVIISVLFVSIILSIWHDRLTEKKTMPEDPS